MRDFLNLPKLKTKRFLEPLDQFIHRYGISAKRHFSFPDGIEARQIIGESAVLEKNALDFKESALRLTLSKFGVPPIGQKQKTEGLDCEQCRERCMME